MGIVIILGGHDIVFGSWGRMMVKDSTMEAWLAKGEL